MKIYRCLLALLRAWQNQTCNCVQSGKWPSEVRCLEISHVSVDPARCCRIGGNLRHSSITYMTVVIKLSPRWLAESRANRPTSLAGIEPGTYHKTSRRFIGRARWRSTLQLFMVTSYPASVVICQRLAKLR